METATQTHETHQANFFLSSEQADAQKEKGTSYENSNSATDADVDASTAETQASIDAIFIKAAREACKLFDTISNYDQLTRQQRDKVRALIEKQRAALDMKISGQKPVDGEDFDSLAKLLRKENNKLDSLLEGKDVLFSRFKSAANQAETYIAQMKCVIAKLEDES